MLFVFIVKFTDNIIIKLLFTFASLVYVVKLSFAEYIGPAILRKYLCIIDSPWKMLSPRLSKLFKCFGKLVARRDKLPIDEGHVIYHVMADKRLLSVHELLDNFRES